MDKITSIVDTKSPSSLSNLISNSDINTSTGTSSSINSGSSIWTNIQNVPLLTWLLIILILALLGFNIFIYLAAGTDNISSLFTKILGILGLTTKKIVDVSLEGSKQIVSGTANIYDQAATTVQNKIDTAASSAVSSSTAKTTLSNDNYTSTTPSTNNINDAQATSLNKALNSAQAANNNSSNDYEADDINSSIQTGGSSSSKAGWCFIGEDRGIRTCAQVGESDTCMSGDIFPSNEICINPKLRP